MFEKVITLKCAEHFATISLKNSNSLSTTELLAEFTDSRSAYVCFPSMQDMLFDVELVDSTITSLSNGKAHRLDELTAEHLKYAHPAIALALTKLFNLMLKCLLFQIALDVVTLFIFQKGTALVLHRLQLMTSELSLAVRLSHKFSNVVS